MSVPSVVWLVPDPVETICVPDAVPSLVHSAI
jgi:hypothetical protein